MKFFNWKNFAVAVCMSLMGAVSAEAASYTINFGTTATPTSLRGMAEELYLKEVETLTNGQVKFNRSWGGALVNNQEVLQAVQDGVIEIGQLNPNFYPKQLILNNAFSLFMQMPTDYMRRVGVFTGCLSKVPAMTKEVEKFGQKIIYTYGVTNYIFVSTKPMNKVSDLKGMKVRASARWLLSLLKEVGATPVAMPLSDAPMAFQTNVMDCGMLSVDATDMMGMLEVAPYALVVREFPVSTPYYMRINTETYNGLPPEIQAKFAEAAVSATKKFAALYNDFLNGILDKWSKNPKYHVTIAGPEFIKDWTSLKGNKDNFEVWVKEATDAGLKDSRKTLEMIYAINDEAIKQDQAE